MHQRVQDVTAGTLRHMGSGVNFGSMGNVLKQGTPFLSRQVRAVTRFRIARRRRHAPRRRP